MIWLVRIPLFCAWAVLGAAATYGTLYFLTPLGWLVLGGVALVGIGLYYLSGERRAEALGIFAGPGAFLIFVGTLGSHDLPFSPIPWGVLMVAPVIAVYAMRVFQPTD